MENNNEDVNITLIKLKVLESRIQKLKSIADELLDEVNSKFQHEIKDLYLKKEEAEQKLLKILEVGNGK